MYVFQNMKWVRLHLQFPAIPLIGMTKPSRVTVLQAVTKMRKRRRDQETNKRFRSFSEDTDCRQIMVSNSGVPEGTAHRAAWYSFCFS